MTTLGTAHAVDTNGRPRYGNTILEGIDVIGQVEQTLTGNTVLRIGRTPSTTDLSSWEKIGHVVLTPVEREALIAKLVAQRAGYDNADAAQDGEADPLARADGRTPTEHQRSEVARLWAEPGLTTRAIAARVGLSDYQVCAIIQGKAL